MIGRILGIDRGVAKCHFKNGLDHREDTSRIECPSLLSHDEDEELITVGRLRDSRGGRSLAYR
jgi:hypothetical protein